MTDQPTDRPTDQNNFEEIENLENPENKSDFRFRCQKALFTYKHHLDKELLSEFLTNLNPKKKMKKVYIAHENGDETCPYLHTHAVVDWGNALDKKSSRFADIEYDEETVHPNIRLIKSDDSWLRACHYLTKEDQTVILAEEDKSFIYDRVLGFKSEAEAMRGLIKSKKDLIYVRSVKEIFSEKNFEWKGKKRPTVIQTEENLRPWQKDIFEKLKEFPDLRKVYWIADMVGHQGKNSLISFLTNIEEEGEKKCILLECETSVDHIMNLFIENIKKGWCGDTVIFNLEKSSGSLPKDQLYRLMEKIKDGKISTTKYKGFNFPVGVEPAFHVIVFSNREPDYNTLVEDRWMVWDIDPETQSLRTLRRCNINKRALRINPMAKPF